MLNNFLVIVVFFLIYVQTIYSFKNLYRVEDNASVDNLDISKIIEIISRTKELIPLRRMNKENRADKVKDLFNVLKRKIGSRQLKKLLRQQQPEGKSVENNRNEFEELIQSELKNALSQKYSALMDRPFVEKNGENDFLVLNSNVNDPFVTIVPNAMYYNIEKKCVNWLDDCNLRGLRGRLLQIVNSPFK